MQKDTAILPFSLIKIICTSFDKCTHSHRVWWFWNNIMVPYRQSPTTGVVALGKLMREVTRVLLNRSKISFIIIPGWNLSLALSFQDILSWVVKDSLSFTYFDYNHMIFVYITCNQISLVGQMPYFKSKVIQSFLYQVSHPYSTVIYFRAQIIETRTFCFGIASLSLFPGIRS